MDLSQMPWREIARKCPMNCEIRYFRGADSQVVFEGGTLLVKGDEMGWLFFHPGLKREHCFVPALGGDDLTPAYYGIALRVQGEIGVRLFYRYNIEGVFDAIPITVNGEISVLQEPIGGSIIRIEGVLFAVICIVGGLLTLRPLCPSEIYQEPALAGKFEGY
jgi:hypothetical protein